MELMSERSLFLLSITVSFTGESTNLTLLYTHKYAILYNRFYGLRVRRIKGERPNIYEREVGGT